MLEGSALRDRLGCPGGRGRLSKREGGASLLRNACRLPSFGRHLRITTRTATSGLLDTSHRVLVLIVDAEEVDG